MTDMSRPSRATWIFRSARHWALLAQKCVSRRGRDDAFAAEYRRAALLELRYALAVHEGRPWYGPFSPPWGHPAEEWLPWTAERMSAEAGHALECIDGILACGHKHTTLAGAVLCLAKSGYISISVKE